MGSRPDPFEHKRFVLAASAARAGQKQSYFETSGLKPVAFARTAAAHRFLSLGVVRDVLCG